MPLKTGGGGRGKEEEERGELERKWESVIVRKNGREERKEENKGGLKEDT